MPVDDILSWSSDHQIFFGQAQECNPRSYFYLCNNLFVNFELVFKRSVRQNVIEISMVQKSLLSILQLIEHHFALFAQYSLSNDNTAYGHTRHFIAILPACYSEAVVIFLGK